MIRLCQIKASAGSGKTYALTRLFLQKLKACGGGAGFFSNACPLARPGAAKALPGDILAITFTNAAASEMRNRVLGELKKVALGGESQAAREAGLDQAMAIRLVDGIMRNMGALNIRTIDSLLHQIVRSAALELGLCPDYEPAFGVMDVFGRHLEDAFDSADEHVRELEERGIGIFGDYPGRAQESASNKAGKPGAGIANLNQPLGSGLAAGSAIGNGAGVCGLLLKICRQLVERDGSRGFGLGKRFDDNMGKCLEQMLNGLFNNLTDPARYAEIAGELASNLASVANRLLQTAESHGIGDKWLARAQNTLQAIAGGDIGKCDSVYAKKNRAEEMFKKDTVIPDVVRSLHGELAMQARDVPGMVAMLKNAAIFAPFVDFSRHVIENYRKNQRQETLLPNIMVPELASRVMASEDGVPAALCRMGSLLTHFMVDEFQDTSRQQWNAMSPLVGEALSRGGSFTWVGDVKQSIYVWRGGDPELFDEIRHKGDHIRSVAANECESQVLEHNWRSREQIINFNNAIFSPLADPQIAFKVLADVLPDKVAKTDGNIIRKTADKLAQVYDRAAQKASASTRPGGLVVIEPVMAATAEEQKTACAARTRELVAGIAQRRRKAGRGQPLSDICILVRKNDFAGKVAAELAAHGIDFVTENSLLLSEHPLIAQTVAFLRFLDNPADNIAFATLAGGPALTGQSGYAGIGWQDVATLGLGRKVPLYIAFREKWPRQWQRFFRRFFSQAGLMSPYDTVMEWYAELDLEITYASEHTYLRRFMELLHMVGQKGPATIAAFLEYWDLQGKYEKVPMPENMDAVRIMTIHKAKGLEAPVVIVPMASLRADGKHNDVVRFEQDGLALAMPDCSAHGPFYYRETARQAIEVVNNLYVAFTRAREELHILPEMKEGEKKHSFLSSLLEVAGMAMPVTMGQPVEDAGRQAQANEDSKPWPLPVLRRVQPAENSGTHRDVDALQENDPDACVTCADGQEAAGSEGQAIRRDLLPKLRLYRDPMRKTMTRAERGTLIHCALELLRPVGDVRTASMAALLMACRRLGLPAICQDSDLDAVAWFAGQPFAARWLGEGLREQGMLDANGENMRMDLLLREDWGYMVVDYKTGDMHDSHLAQVQAYLSVLGEAVGPDVRTAGLLVYLDRKFFMLVDDGGASGPYGDYDTVLWALAEKLAGRSGNAGVSA